MEGSIHIAYEFRIKQFEEDEIPFPTLNDMAKTIIEVILPPGVEIVSKHTSIALIDEHTKGL